MSVSPAPLFPIYDDGHRPPSALRRFGVEPGEGPVFLWSTLALFLLGWTDASMVNVSETFFLKRIGVTLLPVVFLANSLLLIGTTHLAGNLAARSDRLKLLTRGLLVLGLVLLPLWGMVRFGLPGAYPTLVLASKQLKSVGAIFFWVAMGDLLHPRQAKRLFAPLLAGGTLGAIVGSFASAPIGRFLGIDMLLPLSVVTMSLAAAATIPLRKHLPPRLHREPVPAELPGGATGRASPGLREQESRISLGPLWRNSALFRLLLVTALFAGLLGPMLFFQFSYLADAATLGAGGEQRLLDFYAQFRGWLQAGILTAQLLLVSRLFRRIGVPLAAAAVPVSYLLGFGGLALRFDIGAGTAAMAGTKTLDRTIHEPSQKFFFNLFPEEVRPRVVAFLDETVERIGGSVGNILVLLTLAVASPALIGVVGLPFALAWLVGAVALWRVYPTQLLAVMSARRGSRDPEVADLLDARTVRILAGQMTDGPAEACRAAVDLVAEAPRSLSVVTLARAARLASPGNRTVILSTLDRLLEAEADAPVTTAEAAGELEELLRRRKELPVAELATVTQAYGRLSGPGRLTSRTLRSLLEDPAEAVRMAARAALEASGEPDDQVDEHLARAVASDDADARLIGREELRARLLRSDPGQDPEHFRRRLELLASLLHLPADRVPTAEALAEVALRHGPSVDPVVADMISLRHEHNPPLPALLRFLGGAGRGDEAEWILEHVASEEPEVANAALAGLRALGTAAADVLMVALSFGKRSTRDAVLPLVRELAVETATLRQLLRNEVEGVHDTTLKLQALSGGTVADIVRQRLQERIAEGVHTVLLLLSAIHDDDHIADLGARRDRVLDRRERGTLLEAIDSRLTPDERRLVLPVLEDRGLSARAEDAAIALRRDRPSWEEAIGETLAGSDLLVRALLAATLEPTVLARHAEAVRAIARGGAPSILGSEDVMHRIFAGDGDMGDDGDREPQPRMLSEVEIVLHLKTLELFERLTARQLADLARLVRQVRHPAGTVVVREGEYGDCMYFIVSGKVKVTRRGTHLTDMGEREFFGELAVFEGENRSATVEAVADLHLLRLERHDLLGLMEELPGVGIALCQSLSRRVRVVTDRLVPE